MNSEFLFSVPMREFLSTPLCLRGRNSSRDSILSGQFGNIFVREQRQKKPPLRPATQRRQRTEEPIFQQCISECRPRRRQSRRRCAAPRSPPTAPPIAPPIRTPASGSRRIPSIGRVIAAIAPAILVVEVCCIRVIVVHRSPITSAVSRIRFIGIRIEPGPVIVAVVHPVIIWHPIPPFAIVKHESPAIGIVFPVCLALITALVAQILSRITRGCPLVWRAGVDPGATAQRAIGIDAVASARVGVSRGWPRERICIRVIVHPVGRRRRVCWRGTAATSYRITEWRARSTSNRASAVLVRLGQIALRICWTGWRCAPRCSGPDSPRSGCACSAPPLPAPPPPAPPWANTDAAEMAKPPMTEQSVKVRFVMGLSSVIFRPCRMTWNSPEFDRRLSKNCAVNCFSNKLVEDSCLATFFWKMADKISSPSRCGSNQAGSLSASGRQCCGTCHKAAQRADGLRFVS